MKEKWWNEMAILVRTLARNKFYVDLIYLYSQFYYHLLYVYETGDFLNPLQVYVYEENEKNRQRSIYINIEPDGYITWTLGLL